MTDRKTHLDGVAVITLVSCCALWGLNHSITKLTLEYLPPLLQAGLRSLGAALLVALWARWRGHSLSMRNGTLTGGLLAGTSFALEFACIFVGLQFTEASRMIVFVYLAPFVVALGMPLVARSERPTLPQLLGLGVAFSGVAWAFAEGLTDSAGPVQAQRWIGDALGLLAALLWGANTLTIRASRLATAAPGRRGGRSSAVTCAKRAGARTPLDSARPPYFSETLPCSPSVASRCRTTTTRSSWPCWKKASRSTKSW